MAGNTILEVKMQQDERKLRAMKPRLGVTPGFHIEGKRGEMRVDFRLIVWR